MNSKNVYKATLKTRLFSQDQEFPLFSKSWPRLRWWLFLNIKTLY